MPANRRPIEIKDLFRFKIPFDLDLAPDGRALVAAIKSADLRRNGYASHLYRIEIPRGRRRPLTRGRVNDSEPRWSPEGEQIAFVTSREGSIPQVWVLPVSGGEPRPLTRLTGGPVRGLRWSPDGRWLLFRHRQQPPRASATASRQATYKHITRLRHKLDGEGFWPEERWHIWKVAYPSGQMVRLTHGEFDHLDAAWSPNGRRIAFISSRIPEADLHPDNTDLFVMSAAGRNRRQLTRRFGPVGCPAWSLDGRSLFFMGHFGKSGEFLRHPVHIYRVPAAGGRPQDLTPRLNQWPQNWVISDTARASTSVILPFLAPEPGTAAQPARGSRSAVTRRRTGSDRRREERLAIVVNERGACRLYSLPATGGPLRVEFGGAVNVLGVALRPRSAHAAVIAATQMDCGDCYHLSLDQGDAPRRLTRINQPVFDSLALTQPEEVVFRGKRNGRIPIHGWIWKPPRLRRSRRYPLILNIHGGPMAQFGYTFFHEMHYLAAQGYVVVCVNPRGSSGYGLRFMNCILNRWGRLDFDDLMMVTDSMARRPYVDSRRMGVTGGSYGGFMASWIVGHTNRFRAAVTQRQVGNVITQVGSSDLGFYRVRERGCFPWQRPLRYLRDSPNFYAQRIHTPLLIIHSEEDLRCPIAQGEELFTYLKLLGRTVEMIRFQGESHGLSRGGKPQNRRERLLRITAWFGKHL